MKIKKQKQSKIVLLLFLLIVFSVFFNIRIASADTGPKPSITVKVINPPIENYYIDLLEQKEEPGISDIDLKKKLQGEEKLLSKKETWIREVLNDYQVDAWCARLDGGIIDDVYHPSKKSHEYTFDYAVPSEFKVILVTEKETIYVSNMIVKKSYNAQVTYDVSTGILEEQIGKSVIKSIVTSLICYICCILLEGVILMVFGLFYKDNVKKFFFVNTITQTMLNIVIQYVLFVSGGGLGFLLLYLLWEVIICMMEITIYVPLLKLKDGTVYRLRNVCYALVANAVSFFGGMLLLELIL